MSKDYAVVFNNMVWQEKAPGVREKLLETEGSRIRLVEFSEHFVEPDWCYKAHLGYVIEGAFEVEFENVIQAYRQGDGIRIPSGNDHKHRHYRTLERATLFLVEIA